MNGAKLTIYFEDGSTEEILMTEALEVRTPTKSLEFRQDKRGVWRMVVTCNFLNGRKLAKEKLMEVHRVEVQT